MGMATELKLNADYIDKLWSKRKQYLINLPELAIMLNCKHEHMVRAQMGKPVPEDVHRSVVDWLQGY